MSETAIGKGPKGDGIAFVVLFLILLWVINWLWWKAAGIPLPYCKAQEWFGGLALQLHDGIRACLFVVLLGALCAGRLKYLAPALGMLAFNLMLPGFLVTLFSFREVCRL